MTDATITVTNLSFDCGCLVGIDDLSPAVTISGGVTDKALLQLAKWGSPDPLGQAVKAGKGGK
jgi:hypothetical protein